MADLREFTAGTPPVAARVCDELSPRTVILTLALGFR